jgi:NAD+ kinase
MPLTSPPRSTAPSPPGEAGGVARAALVVHGREEVLGDAVERLRALAAARGVTLTDDAPELAVVLGGDGTMLRALQRFLGTGVPCLGVNFGRVGFLTSVHAADLEPGLEDAFGGGYVAESLSTVTVRAGAATATGINDVVLTSGQPGRMAIVEWLVGGQSLGELGCDGVIVATPTGSTAYNLSAGGPVLAAGTEGFVVTFVSPHSLHARSMVLGRPHLVELRNRSADVPLQVVVDGHAVAEVPPGEALEARLGDATATLARIRGTSFFTRYLDAFGR